MLQGEVQTAFYLRYQYTTAALNQFYSVTAKIKTLEVKI